MNTSDLQRRINIVDINPNDFGIDWFDFRLPFIYSKTYSIIMLDPKLRVNGSGLSFEVSADESLRESVDRHGLRRVKDGKPLRVTVNPTEQFRNVNFYGVPGFNSQCSLIVLIILSGENYPPIVKELKRSAKLIYLQ
jgi:hypothetical protein